MSGKKSEVVVELSNFVRAFWLELPIAAANRILGNGDDQALNEAGWKAYDAFVSLTNEATNQLYQDRTVGTLVGRATETALRAQHIGNALISAFLGNLRSAIGLPTASEIAAPHTDLAAVRTEPAAALENRAIDDAPAPRSRTLTDDGVRFVGNGHVPSLKDEDDEDAAA